MADQAKWVSDRPFPTQEELAKQMAESKQTASGVADKTLGYVVVEFNQASGEPRVSTYSGYGGDIYCDQAEAEDILAMTRAEMAKTPRRETFALAEVRMLGERSDG